MQNAGQLHMKHKKSKNTMIIIIKADRLFLNRTKRGDEAIVWIDLTA